MPNPPVPIDRRYHALDALRAIMMLLGLVLHAAVSYGAVDYGQAWGFKDQSTSPVCDLLVIFIHVFRMPVFFVMAGFFTALLLMRRGVASMARNRALRIGVPFAVGWVLLTPLTISGFIFANAMKAQGFAAAWPIAWGEVASGRVYADTTIHLWFLYDLMLFYVAALALRFLTSLIPAPGRAVFLRAFSRVLTSRWRVFAFALLSLGTLSLTPGGFLVTSVSFVPEPIMLLNYGLFFGFGWLLYHVREHIAVFDRGAWSYTIVGIVLFPFNGAAAEKTIELIHAGAEMDLGLFATTAITGSLMVWCFVFGLTGLFMRFMDRSSPTVRYIVDASYWLYLIHLPFTIWLPGLMSHLALPALVKMALVLLIAAPIWLLSYDLLVRNTWIGVILNGRRYRRGRPELDPAGKPIEPAVLTLESAR